MFVEQKHSAEGNKTHHLWLTVDIRIKLTAKKLASSRMRRSKFSRIAPATVIMMVILTLIILNEEAVILVIPHFPKSLSFLTSHREGTICKCLIRSWPDSEVTAAYLNLSLSWLSNTSTIQDLRSRHPNLPIELLHDGKHKRCSLLPTLFSTEWRNKHWQLADLDVNSKFYLYSAFFDPETDGQTSIRLLGVYRSRFPAFAWCHVWFSPEAPPLLVKVTNKDYLDYQSRSSGRQMPFLLRCPLPPKTTDIPFAVSLTAKPCGEATNLLKVIGSNKREVSAYRNKKVPNNPRTLVKGWMPAVCGPALFYYQEDFSVRLVEWLELLRAQGFGQVFLYVTDVHPNITEVLRHYVQEGFVQVTDYNYPPPYVNDPSLRRLWTMVERKKMFAQENVYFTDCVLRHMHEYRFLAHVDPDEVPVLLKHDNFTHLLDDLIDGMKGTASPGYLLHWMYFFDNLPPAKEAAELPDYLWMLRHIQRQAKPIPNPNPGHFKPIYDMNVVRGVFSHGTILCISGGCNNFRMKRVSPEIAYMGHFKLTCDRECTENTVQDFTLLKLKNQVGPKVEKILNTLHLL